MVLVDLAKNVNPVAVISGTNGKTTTTNLVADCLQTAGVPLYCNREGNNLQSGIVTSLMLAPDTSKVVDAASAAQAPVGCFECDEMYTKYVLPRLRPHYFMLLNLFRDQLDRFGEIDRIQATIAEALAKTPETTFVFNGDDPLCAAIADRIPNKALAFGIASDMGLSADRISDSRFCQKCGGALEYDYVHYGQLGAYRCPDCGWARPELAFAATNVRLEEDASCSISMAAACIRGTRAPTWCTTCLPPMSSRSCRASCLSKTISRRARVPPDERSPSNV